MRSWLVLERFALGEVTDTALTQAIAGDAVASARLAQIREERIVLRPLVVALQAAPWWQKLRWYWLSFALAPATAVILLWPAPNAIKGGDLSLYLVRERDGSIAYDGDVFSPGDRFKLALTCPPGAGIDYRVHVQQDGTDSQPFAPGHIDECGNHIALPGALQLDGQTPVAVCVDTAKGRPCVELRPAR